MLFMVVERYRNGDPQPVYRRLGEEGRLVPDGVRYVGSWVSDDLTHCFQVMDAVDRSALDAWAARWSDLVDFEIVPVISSAEAARRAGA